MKELAECRLQEAMALLQAGRYEGAYYLGGYAVECALKAVIASTFRANEIPDFRRVQNIYIHDLKKLLELANLTVEHSQLIAHRLNLRRTGKLW